MAKEIDAKISDKSNLIRPLSESETNQFLDYCKDLFLNSIDDKRKNDPNSEELYEKIKKLSYVHNKIDPKCILRINKRLVRVEYPGEVKNIDKAIQTLGGIENIEATVADQKKKLELRFHPNNRFSKPCLADKDFKPGILIKAKKNKPKAGSSKDIDAIQEEFTYTVEGISVMNFVFNRLCEFQYLPLIAEQPETKSSKTEFIYDKLMPDKIPDMEWFNREELKNMEHFLLPVRFSRYDNCNQKLNLDNSDKCDDISNDSSIQTKSAAKKRKLCKIFGKKQQISIFVTFKDKEIPKKPLDGTVKIAASRSLDEQIVRVKQLFEQRPIWTKSAVIYNTGITVEHSKIILPMVAYHFINGPWRISWVKYGYDPRLDPEARIYQTLDYRIRAADSTKLKVNAKRTYASKTTLSLGPNHVKKVSLKDGITTKQRSEIDERCYVLRPLTIPPARQMFYQLCDLIIPEIQDRVSRLPHQQPTVCDPKNGWLPKRFIEDCREIVNRYVLDAVQQELLKDKEILQEKVTKEQQTKINKDKTSSIDYCNQMLSNIKKGIYKKVNIKLSGPSLRKDTDLDNLGDDVEMINLSGDDDDDDYDDDEEELTVGEIIQNSIPETMENVREDDEDDDDDDDNDNEAEDDEIDMEAVEEINKMIMGGE